MDLHRAHASNWRWLAVAGLAAIAAIHLDIAPEHLREAPYAGVLFIALSAAALTCAVLLAGTNHRLIWSASAALSLGALVAYGVTRSVGLPMLSDDIGDWLNPLGVAAVVAETAVVVISGHALAGADRYRRRTATVRLYTVVPPNPTDPNAGGYT
jgi:hypothetical protein